MRSFVVVSIVLFLAVLAGPVGACVGLVAPVDGPVVAGFSPSGRYGGHWGIDLAVPSGTTVRSAGRGTVSFAGVVAGMRAVTVDHGGGLLSTVSYVADIDVDRGAPVLTGAPIARSGDHEGRPSVHVSTRIDGRYVDPATILGCAATTPVGAVRLVPVP